VTESRSDQATAAKLCARDKDDPTGDLYEVAVDPATGAVLVSASALPLATGAATSAKQDTGNTSLASIDTKTPALGATTPSGSTPVTGSLATSFATLAADATATGSAVQLSSLAAGPSGIRVQNTSASGQPNIRVGGSSASATRGVQLSPGQWEIFAVDNANRLWVIAESGSPTYGVSQA
jgi:hypothetical protein